MARRFRPDVLAGRVLGDSLGDGLDVFGGCERRVAGEPYRWEGLRRSRRDRRAVAVIQYTFAGRGAFDTPDRHFDVQPQDCFFAIIPSAHVYYLPDDVDAWTFVWIMVDHPYVLQRLEALVSHASPVIHAPAGTDLPDVIGGLLAQHAGLKPAAVDDRFARERRLFDLIVAAERAAHAVRHGGDEREQLLSRTRQILEAGNMLRPNVDAIAAEFGMSRSNFSHHFRAITGLTPAAFVRDTRLALARDQLVGTDLTLKAIARALGFADVNHFCKSFRTRFGFTPGAFRKQVQGHWTA